jgi:beta-mannanase
VVRIQKAIGTGREVFIRYAPEMNGNWFAYGQQPEKFVTHWRRVVTFIKNGLGSNSSHVAFIWAPNSANGYVNFETPKPPFFGGVAGFTLTPL